MGPIRNVGKELPLHAA